MLDSEGDPGLETEHQQDPGAMAGRDAGPSWDSWDIWFRESAFVPSGNPRCTPLPTTGVCD